jgi:hypothetical protein
MLYSCSWCIDAFKKGKIDAIPYWYEVDGNIRNKHYRNYIPEIEISHGICSECHEKVIKELYTKWKLKK